MTKQQLLQGLKKTATQRRNRRSSQAKPGNKFIDFPSEGKEWSSHFSSFLKTLQRSPLPVI
jgi:hypothetical protein